MASQLPITSLTFAEDLGTDVVDIFVGSDRKRFVVHKQPLISGSDYFNKALNGGFREATENAIHLEELDPAAVGLMIGWIYRGVIPGMEKSISPFTRPGTSNRKAPAFVPNSASINGTQYPYSATLNTQSDVTGRELYTHISAHPHYSAFSSEELRLTDYNLGRRNTPSMITNSSATTATTSNSSGAPRPYSSSALYNTTNTAGSSVFNIQPAGSRLYQRSSLFGGLSSHYDSYNLSNTTGSGIFNNQASTGSSLFRNIQSDSGQSQGTQDHGHSVGLENQPRSNSTSGSRLSNTSDMTNNMFATTILNQASSNINNLDSITQPEPSNRVARQQSFLSPKNTDSGPIPNDLPTRNDKARIPGIPEIQPPVKSLNQEDAQVLSLLNLCIFAETICWPALYNAVIEAYIRSELSLVRPIPVQHVAKIYDQTHSESSLRKFALESIFRSGLKTSTYIDVARDYDDLFEEIMSQLSIRCNDDDHQIDDAKIRSYYMVERLAGKQKDIGDGNTGMGGNEVPDDSIL